MSKQYIRNDDMYFMNEQMLVTSTITNRLRLLKPRKIFEQISRPLRDKT